MKFGSVFFLVLAVIGLAMVAAEPVEEPMSLLELENVPDLANIGYIPDATTFDNANTLAERTPTIPNSPDCTVRPQTIVEIKRMRRSAARIAQMIQTEVAIMEKRKTYIEQMTSYLNDRIRELNKVKGELEQENKWIEVSNNRIAELAEREKLIKMQDIVSCLNSQAQRLGGQKDSTAAQMTKLQTKTKTLEENIAKIKTNIENAGKGGESSASF